MAYLRIIGSLLVIALQGLAQEEGGAPALPAPPAKWNVALPANPAGDTAAVPALELPAVSGRVVSSHTYRHDVTESPPMEGLPPVEGPVSTTIEVIESPVLSPALPPEIPVMPEGRGVQENNIAANSAVFISALVHDNHRSFLRIHFHGDPGNDVVAWSNLDFNVLRGWNSYHVTAGDGSIERISLLLAVGNVGTADRQENASQGGNVSPLVIPALTDAETAGPLFHVVSGTAGTPAMDVLEQLHDLFRKESVRLTAAYEARQQAEADRRAQLLANPPKPGDVTIRYWKGTTKETEVTE